MKRKTLLLACSLLVIALTGLLAGCATTSTVPFTSTTTATAPNTETVTVTNTETGPVVTSTPPTVTVTSGVGGVVSPTTTTIEVQTTVTVTPGTSITVLNPVPVNNFAARTALTPRLASSLAGKNIYLIDVGWGGKDEAYTALGYLKTALQTQIPTATITLVRKPGNFSNDTVNDTSTGAVAALFKQIAAANGVAVIGITGGDVSSADLAAQASELESLGVPTVAIVEASMIKFVAAKYNGYDFLYDNGMPVRMVAFPTAFDGYPASYLQTYVSGNDPVENIPFVQEIIDGLTKPLGQSYCATPLPAGISETFTGAAPAAVAQPQLLPADTDANLRVLFQTNDWTANEPIVLPTQALVSQMEAGTSHLPSEVVYTSNWPGGARKVTVEDVAIAAVMAGCVPADFPSCLAIAQQSTSVLWGDLTGSWAYTIIFNGPVRNTLGVNSGGGVMEPYAFANSVFGNFLTIVTKTCNNFHNAGASTDTGTGIIGPTNSSVPDTNFRAIGSYMGEDNLCVGEYEEKLPAGWNPLSVQDGFAAGTNVVTLGMGFTKNNCVGEQNVVNPATDWMGDYARASCGYGALTWYIDPWEAQILHDSNTWAAGTTFSTVGALNLMSTKEMFSAYEAGYVKKTVAAYWADSIVDEYIYPEALAGVQPYAGWLADLTTNPNLVIHPYAYDAVSGAPNNGATIHAIVCGGMLNTMWDCTDFQLGKGVDISTWQ